LSSADLDEVFAGRVGPGLHRIDGVSPEGLAEAAAGHGWVPVVVETTGAADKAGLLAALAAAGRFPDWAGANWDALQDALGDLSWLGPAEGYLVVLVGWAGVAPAVPADCLVVESVLAAAAAEWADRGTPFVTLTA
jgi:hypothetical protein